MFSLEVRCDCEQEDCKYSLIISPCGSIALSYNNKILGGLHVSNIDIDKIIAQLTEVKKNNIDVEEDAKRYFQDILEAKKLDKSVRII